MEFVDWCCGVWDGGFDCCRCEKAPELTWGAPNLLLAGAIIWRDAGDGRSSGSIQGRRSKAGVSIEGPLRIENTIFLVGVSCPSLNLCRGYCHQVNKVIRYACGK